MTRPSTAQGAQLREQAEAAGFTVTVAVAGYQDAISDVVYPSIYRVEGFGLDMTLTDDDTALWQEILGHAEVAVAAPEPEPAP